MFGPVCIFKKKLKYVGVGFGFFFFAFINMAGKKLNLLTLLWSSYPLTLATFLVELHNTKVYNIFPHYN